jgi:hypothetical protein
MLERVKYTRRSPENGRLDWSTLVAQTLADKVTIYFRTPTPELESKLIGMANASFGFCFLMDAIKVSRFEGEIYKALVVYSNRQDRIKFANFVKEAYTLLGHDAGMEGVLVEVNGVAGIYKAGEDYEQGVVPKEAGVVSV